VIAGTAGTVAAVRARLRDGREKYWLPGGGIEADESPRDAIIREVHEELGRDVRVLDEIGEAIQFFYAATDERWFEMHATFFRAMFDDSPPTVGEHELHWIDPRADASLFFHECHVWAMGL
jgi:8-oxo-dGTP diphosphatase